MEKVDIKKVRCQAKVVGTIVTVAGAMLMTLYKGHVINLVWSNIGQHQASSSNSINSNANDDKDWFKGSILLIFATLAWASFFIIQAVTLKKYSAQLSLTALVCFMGTLQSIAVTFVMEHRPSVWSIGWDTNLLAAAYAVIKTTLSLSLIYLYYQFKSYKYKLIIYFLYICMTVSGYSLFKHRLLCSRACHAEKRTRVCYCFQSSDDDHCGLHGLFHPCRKDLHGRVRN